MTNEFLPSVPEQDVPLGRSSQLANTLRSQEVDFAYTPLDSHTYEGIFVLNHGEEATAQTVPSVRLYRGISDLGESVLNQVPYAAKALFEDGNIKPLDNPEHLARIERFVGKPTYTNLRDYVEPMLASVSQYTASNMKTRLRKIENEILAGHSLAEGLTDAHISSFVGRGEADISPYISTASTAEIAQCFGQSAVLVLDVQASQVQGDGEPGEVLIAGKLPPTAITAIAIKRGNHNHYGIEEIVGSFPPLPGGSIAFADAKRNMSSFGEATEADKLAVSTFRTSELWKMIPDNVRDKVQLPEDGADSYRRLQTALFDFFMASVPDMPVLIYRNQLQDPDYNFDYRVNMFDRKCEPYNRKTITDGMLAEMQQEYLIEVRNQARRVQRLGERLLKMTSESSSEYHV